jgi:hypothetical protein
VLGGVESCIPPANEFKATVDAVGGNPQFVSTSVIQLITVGGGAIGTTPTVKFENWRFPTPQPSGTVTGIVERAVGAAGQGTIAAHAGAANASGIATVRNRLNINVFFIYLGRPPNAFRKQTPRLQNCTQKVYYTNL